jgi:hypothetical protein
MRSDGSIGPDYLDMNRKNLDALESIARHDGGTEKGNRGDTYDKIHLASEMLNNVLSAKSALARLVEQEDCERAKPIAYYAIAEVISLAINYHHWTIVAHETPIAGHISSVAGAKRGAKARAKINSARNVEMAEQFRAAKEKRTRQKGRLSDTRLMEDIGKKYNLGTGAARAAIKDGLKMLTDRRK